MKLVKIKGQLVDFSKPKIMGIINVSPDSFYVNSRKNTIKEVLNEIEKQLQEGADFIDIGAMSSRPQANYLSENEEFERIKPIVLAIEREFPNALFSVDTFSSTVTKFVLDHGVGIINDISAFQFNEKLFEVLASYKPCYILMHNNNDFQKMHNSFQYESIFKECLKFFTEKLVLLKENNINDVIIDLGFGFAKNLDQNYSLFQFIKEFTILNRPILVGVSRKSMIYKLLEIDIEDSQNGSTVLHTLALLKGAKILRVHDVAPAKEVIKIFEKLNLFSDIHHK